MATISDTRLEQVIDRFEEVEARMGAARSRQQGGFGQGAAAWAGGATTFSGSSIGTSTGLTGAPG